MISRQKSIRRHLVTVLTTSLIVLYGASACLVFFLVRGALTEQLDAGILRLAKDFIAETKRTVDGGVDSEFHELELEDFGNRSVGGSYYELRDAGGQAVYRSRSLGEKGSIPYRPTEGEEISFSWGEMPDGVPGRILQISFPLALEKDDAAEIAAWTPEQRAYVETYDPNDPANRTHLIMAEDSLELERTMFVLGSTLGGTGLLLVLATFFLVRRIVDSACLPLVELTARTERIGPGDLAVRLPTEGLPVELLPLIAKFNLFIERLDEAIKRERRFSVGMAHELRTPVAELRALMDVAVASFDHSFGEGESGLEPKEVYLTGSEIGERMGRIIEVLTSVYRADQRSVEIASESVDLEKLLGTTLAGLGENARRRVRFDPSGDAGTGLRSDPAILRAVCENLVNNALAHSPHGTSIAIAWSDDGFSVTNEAPDLVEADLANLGEPFWQADASRTSTDQFGLGLTLVSHYLRLLEGRLEFLLEDGKLTAAVRMPRDTGESSPPVTFR